MDEWPFRDLIFFLLFITSLGSVLIPLVLTLFFLSTPQSRRHPVFILNIMACCCGITEAIIAIILTTRLILYPLQPISRALFTCNAAFPVIASLFIESILVFRILAFYPLSVTPTSLLVAVFLLPILVKCGRFITGVLYLHQLTHFNSPNILLAAESIWSKNPYLLTGSSLQVIDNCYASIILIYKIQQFRRGSDVIFVIRSDNLLARLRSLLIISLGNFVFPAVINIASIILIGAQLSLIGASYVLLFNSYTSIIGMLFATIWIRRQYWNRHNRLSGSNDFQLEQNMNRPATSFVFDPNMMDMRSVSTLHFGDENEAGSVDTGNRTNVQKSSIGNKSDNIAAASDLNSSHITCVVR